MSAQPVPLHDPGRHEPVTANPWDADVARAFVLRYVEDASREYSSVDLWRAHPLDREDTDPEGPFTMLYFGAAGVIWALDHLARVGAAARDMDLAGSIGDLVDRNRVQVEPWGYGTAGLLMGEAGIRLLQVRLARDRGAAEVAATGLAAAIAANAEHPSQELLWGSPGTMHAALTMHEWTGEPRWAELFRTDAAALLRRFVPTELAPCRIWTQDLYGSKERFLGAGHGFAGNASALIRGRDLLTDVPGWEDAIVATAQATALRVGPWIHWAPLLRAELPAKLLVQWCHGAPGMVSCLAGLPDPRLDELLVGAGEATWVAGPLAKGAGLCHGTAGNGYTFLKLFARTGDELWLDRARAFAMHAIGQSERMAGEFSRRRHSLWTGDAGVACYLWSCITGDAGLPNLDPA